MTAGSAASISPKPAPRKASTGCVPTSPPALRLNRKGTTSIEDKADIVSILREILTSFEVPTDPAEEVYYNAGLFATRLRDGIVDKTLSEESIDRAFAALNRLGASEDVEVQNQLQVSILEVLYDEWESYTAARQKLDGRALQLFEDVERFLRVPEPKTGE